MKHNIMYGECLSTILQALDLKISKLAREINIDSSLIYKWRRNERVPSFESPYTELILKCIEKRLLNPSQRSAAVKVLSEFGIDLADPNDKCILDNLRLILQKSQGYSIQLHNKMKTRRRSFSPEISIIADFIEKADKTSQASEKYGYLSDSLHGYRIGPENLLCSCDHIDIIEGELEVFYSLINLLRHAPNVPPPENSAILMTYNCDMQFLNENTELYNVLFNTLYDLLRGGWKIIIKIRLDNNVDRTMKFIKHIQSLLAAGSLTIYYELETLNSCSGTELYIVPQTGALISFSTNARNLIDSAFLFRAKKSMEMLSERFFNSLNSTRSLLKSYPTQESTEFQRAFAESEEIAGDRYVFKDGLSTVTIPSELYEKYLRLSGKSDQEISHRTFLHKRRLAAFEEQVRYFKFKDICFIESMNALVNKKLYSPDENYLFKNNIPDDEDIILHLENLIFLLNRWDNYNIAFVRRSQFAKTASVNWMVKGKDNVLIAVFRNDPGSRQSPHLEMNFAITEKSVAGAFHDYFLTLWDSIPDEGKDKRLTIAWLKSLIKKIQHSR